jgi:hypothetical protein
VAKSKIPGPLARRHLIEKGLDAPAALAIAEAYLADGRKFEALDFLAKAEAREKLAELREEAISEGDTFLVQAIARHLREPSSSEEWQRAADAAEAAGKERYAATARRQAGREKE